MADKRVILPVNREELVEKWLPVIEGTGKWEAVVENAPKVDSEKYENLAVQLELLEQTELREGVETADVATYKPVLIPMVRRVMPSLISNDIFGVQPMSGPTGLIFALRSTFQGNADDALKRSTSVILVLADATGFVDGTAISTNGTGAGVGEVVHVEGNNVLVKITSGSFAASDSVDDAETYAAAATTVSAVYENEALFDIIFTNYSGSFLTADGEKLRTDTMEMGFEIESQEVKARTRKLKARWSRELEEDLRAVHGKNAEQLLARIATDEIAMEMNREFINIAGTLAVEGGTTAWDYDNADGRWEIEKYQNLAATISRVRRKVAVANKRGQANFMIVSPAVLSALEATGRLTTVNRDPVVNAFVGTFDGMRVFVDIYALTNYLILGYKGREEIDAGAFIAPYVPLKINKGFGEEDNIPRLFFSTRYGIGYNPFGGKNYFRKITVANLPL